MAISNEFIKTCLMILVLLFYLYDLVPVLKFSRIALYLSIPGSYFLYVIQDPTDFIKHPWRTWATPLTYILVVIFLEYQYRTRTGDPGYSLMIAFYSALLIGYLYEIPRFISLESHIIRWNKDYIARADPAMVAIPALSTIILRKWNIKPVHVLTFLIYLVFSYYYMIDARLIRWIRWNLSIRGIPGIMLIRIPALIFICSLYTGFNKRETV